MGQKAEGWVNSSQTTLHFRCAHYRGEHALECFNRFRCNAAKMTIRNPIPLAMICSLAVTGCAPTVELAVPYNVSSDDWSVNAADPAVLVDVPASLGIALGNPQLDRLIQQARLRNTQVGIARARVRQARGLLSSARGAMVPVVMGSAGISQSRNSNAGNPFDFSESFVGVDVSFDVDVFGEARAERRAAGHRVQASERVRDAVGLAVEADVARAFVRHAALTERISILDHNTSQAVDLERIIAARVRGGDATRVDLGLQTIQVRQLQAERLRLVQAREATRTALAVLVGEEAPSFATVAEPLAAFVLPEYAVPQPAILLTRRPDILSAEATLAAADGDVAQARAAFLPRINLSARTLLQTISLTGPLSSGSSIGLDILGPIFNRGRLRGNLAVNAARQLEAAELYRESILIALAEVEDALSAGVNAGGRELLISQIVDEAQITARLARLQYIEGEADLQQVLDAEQLLSAAEDAAAIARQDRLEANIDLFRAIGGPLTR